MGNWKLKTPLTVELRVDKALREVLPTEEIAIVGAVVDEEGLVKGLDEAIDGQALRGAAKSVVEQPGENDTSP